MDETDFKGRVAVIDIAAAAYAGMLPGTGSDDIVKQAELLTRLIPTMLKQAADKETK
jgi:hypothetical protein